LFQNIRIDDEGSITIGVNQSRPNDRITFRIARDLIFVVSACPNDLFKRPPLQPTDLMLIVGGLELSFVVDEPALLSVTAGEQVTFEARIEGAGAALFAWANGDCYEQLSDAYTFMELRKSSPEPGDVLYSTLRRPLLTLASGAPRRSIDLLRHDRWHSRAQSARVLSEIARRRDIAAPELRDWPYAINLFALTRVENSETLIDEQLVVPIGSFLSVIARLDLILCIVPAGPKGALSITR
jgi:uncharacterized protein YcgI (DUF1989 family)